MNIDEMTIGQAREIAQLFAAQKTGPNIGQHLIGQYVIARCSAAGVHAGVLIERAGQECVLRDARRLWYWKPKGLEKFLDGVALTGLHADSRVGAQSQEPRLLLDCCEISACTVEAEASIREQPAQKRAS